MLQLLDPRRQGLLPGFLGGLAAVVATQVCKAFITVRIGPELVGEAPDSLVTENLRVDAVLLEDRAHGLAVHELLVGRALEFGREVDPARYDAGNIGAFPELGELLRVQFFLGHNGFPFRLDGFEHYYTRNVPTRECPR